MKEETMFASDKTDEGSAKKEVKDVAETDEKDTEVVETDNGTASGKSDESEGQDEDEGEKGKNEKDEKLFNDEQQAIFDKRVGKEIAKRKELEEKLKELEAKVEEVKEKIDPDVASASQKLGVPAEYLTVSEAKIIAEYDKWTQVRDFCRKHPDGYVGKGGGDKDFSSDEIREWKEKALDNLAEVAPEAKSIRQAKQKEIQEDLALARRIKVEKAKAVKTKQNETKKPAASTRADGGAAPASTDRPSKTMNKEQFTKLAKEKGNEDAVLKFFGDLA